ncbi:MAG: hypothetical protein LBF75_08065 [Treponema sp.]|jgi:hypothetical protein|nr:hypothetical protein [Treponema sp.]
MVIEEDRVQQEPRFQDEAFHETLYQERHNRACKGVCKKPFRDRAMYHGKIYCANCRHCKLLTGTLLVSSVIPLSMDGEDQYVPRIRCAAGKWKKKLGQEKLYKYSTIIRRYLDYCDAYEAMGDAKEFIQELKKNISDKDTSS